MNIKTIGALTLLGALTPIQTTSQALNGPIGVYIPTKPEILKHARHVALLHGVDAELYIAILRTESSLNPKAYNARSQDTGLAQVNKHTARAHGLNAGRLKHDYKYNLNSGALILADFKRRYEARNPKLWPCRYNVGSGALQGPKLARCMAYLQRVKAAY